METMSAPSGATLSAPAAPTQQSIIPDPSVYEGETAAALQAYQNAISSIAARRANTLQSYGFTAQVSPSGQLQNYSIDANNPYGAIQTLLGNEGTNLTNLQHASVARGIGHLGLGAQGASAYRTQMGGEQQQLGQQFVGEIGQEASDQLGASTAYNEATVQAQRDALLSAIASGAFTPVKSTQATYAPPTNNPQPQPMAPVNVKGTKNAAAGFFALNPVAGRGI